MNFFKHLYRSAWDFAWLSDMSKKPGTSLMYLVLFMLIVVLVVFAPELRKVPRLGERVHTVLDQQVPVFTAHISDGVLTVTELEQPYSQTFGEEDDRIFIYIDTVSEGVPELSDLAERTDARSVALITKDEFMVKEQSGEISGFSFSDIEDEVNFSKSDVVNIVETVIGPLMYPIVIVGLLAIIVFWTIGKLIFLAWLSLLAWAVSSIGKKGWNYGRVYMLGMSAIIAPTVVELIFISTVGSVSLVYTAIYLVTTLLTIWKFPIESHAPAQAD